MSTPTASPSVPTRVSEQQRNVNLARIRDNQRRSRARRKEYLEELEGKLRNCQQLGIEASAEIQLAARRVVDENKRLRHLLKRQGLSDAEIDGHLPMEPSPTITTSSPQHTPAGALEGMLGTRKACNCDDSPNSGNETCLPGPSLELPPTPFPPLASNGPYLAPRPPSQQQQPQHHPHPPPIPVNFQHFHSAAAPPPSDRGPFTSQPHPSPDQPVPDLPSHSVNYDFTFDEPPSWLMDFAPPPTPPPAPGSDGGGGGGGTSSASALRSNPSNYDPSISSGNSQNRDHGSGGRAASGEGGPTDTSSCVAAADLIRTIEPDIELAELERELGCADGGECKVSLVQIFSIMNRVAERAGLSGGIA